MEKIKKQLNRIFKEIKFMKNRRLIEKSSYFDSSWYLQNHLTIGTRVSPIRHYFKFGESRGLCPSPKFDPEFYRTENPDVSKNNISPLLHFLRHGASEGRSPLPKSKTSRARNKIELSSYFNADWYIANHWPSGSTELALAHYLKNSPHSNSPSHLFDASRYLAEYPDVAAAKIQPLLHFLDSGIAEGRWARPVIASGNALQEKIFSGTRHNEVLPTTACMIHAFYPDVFEELAPLLSNLPDTTNFFISVPDAGTLEQIATACVQAGISARADCRILPNRGRNFGALMAFAEQILRHDVVLHLHTKRSLYTGADRKDWRRTLFDSLVGSKGMVQLVLESFSRHPELGLFHPSTLDTLPYWAHHWLSNAGLGMQLLERLQVEKPEDPYIAYPVGGMFWARVDAIRPLLASGFAYDDFSVEAGQTDGTLAHAIERVIGLLSASRGFRAVELDKTQGFRLDKSTLNLWQYNGSRRRELSAAMTSARLISFDIFDTLLVRPCLVPDSALRYLGSLIESRNPALGDFFQKRRSAENQVRQSKNWKGDVNLSEIYLQLARNCNLEKAAAEELMHQELALESAMLRPREDMRDVLVEAKKEGRRVIVISDTYFPLAFIERLFEDLNLRQYVDEFYLSSVCNARKDRGDLWNHVADREKVAVEHWLHIGDNEQSDIQACCDRGIGLFHVMHPRNILAFTGFKNRAKDGWASHLALGPAMLAVANSPFTPLSNRVETLPTAKAFGFSIFGPLVLAFTGWLASHPALKYQDKVLFLSREGFLLQKAYEKLRSYGVPGLPPSEYFFISRRAALSAVQAVEFDVNSILGSGHYQGTFGNLLNARLGFKPAMTADLSNWEIRIPGDTGPVSEALQLLREEIVTHATDELNLLNKYCLQTGIAAGGAFGVVDIGYSGTIQRCLQQVVPASLTGFYFSTFKKIQATEDAGGHSFGYFSDFIDPEFCEHPLVKHSLFVESFLTAPHGQVRGYEDTGEQVVPVFKDIPQTSAATCALEDMHAGALDYIEDILKCYGPHLISLPLGRDAAQEPLRLYAEKRLLPPPGLLDILSVEDDFTGRGLVGFNPPCTSTNN